MYEMFSNKSNDHYICYDHLLIMPRPKRIRKMTNPPHFKGFRPIGLHEDKHPIVMNFEEYEAIRLSDFELLSQVEAANIMNISRPTFARIYESARRKVAQAFVGGHPIVFEGGKVYFDSEWFSCQNCGCWFNHPQKDQDVKNCALCGSDRIEQYHDNNGEINTENICICPKCGKEKEHTNGVPCRLEICTDCNCPMVRKGMPQSKNVKNRNCN